MHQGQTNNKDETLSSYALAVTDVHLFSLVIIALNTWLGHTSLF